jgi:hypothetical protein
MDILALAELATMTKQQADGFSDDATVAIAQQACPLPWRANDIEILDANGHLVAQALTMDLALPLTVERFAVAHVNAQHIADAVNAQAHQKTMLLAAREHASARTLAQIATLLHKTYNGAPIGADGRCALCGELKGDHDDACPVYDLSEALSEEDGRSWDGAL